MSEENQEELTLIKKRADMLGIKYHPNTGLAKLKAKVEAELVPDAQTSTEVVVGTSEPKRETPNARAARQRKEARELIRVNITCMNPNKREYEGENFTISNGVIGSISRYIPYNAEDGWHIERALYNLLKEKKCQIFKTKKDSKGRKVRRGETINEFAIEVLKPLTRKEIKALAALQAVTQQNED